MKLKNIRTHILRQIFGQPNMKNWREIWYDTILCLNEILGICVCYKYIYMSIPPTNAWVWSTFLLAHLVHKNGYSFDPCFQIGTGTKYYVIFLNRDFHE